MPARRRGPVLYLAFLASIGYPLSAIEQAVADGIAYSGDQPAGDSLPGTDPGDSGEGGTRAADAAA